MNAQRDTNGIVRSWLENGVTDLPDRVLDPVLDQLPSTPQRRHSWQARRLTKMNTTLKIAGTAAAVVVLGVVGMTLLRGSPASSVGTPPSMAPTPTAVPSQAPSASTVRLLPSSAFVLEPGRYRIGNVSFLVPAGWTGHDTLILKDNAAAANAALFAVWPITGTFVDPCTDHTLVTPTPGPGIDDLADALASQRGTSASPPRRVNVDGYPAKVVDVTVTADIDACEPAGEGFWLWAAPGGDRRYVQGANELNQIYIVDVDGERVTFNSRIPEATTAADRAELDAIIASVEIEG